jgi:hypothetical protein
LGAEFAYSSHATAAPPPSPTQTLTFNPQMPSVHDTVPLGMVIATVTAAWSAGSPFTGTLMFGVDPRRAQITDFNGYSITRGDGGKGPKSPF